MSWRFVVIIGLVTAVVSVLPMLGNENGLRVRAGALAANVSEWPRGRVVASRWSGRRLVVVLDDGRVYVKILGRAERPRLIGNYWNKDALMW